MNVLLAAAARRPMNPPAPSPRSVNLAATPYQPRSEREPGTGYGRSQGYAASQRSYLSSPRPALFRVV